MLYPNRILQVFDNRKEPEPQFIISAPAPGGNLISASGSSSGAPQHWFTVYIEPNYSPGKALRHLEL
jgi:hypothetical protein